MSKAGITRWFSIGIVTGFCVFVVYAVISIITVYEVFDTTCGLNSWMNVGYQRFYYKMLQHKEKSLSFFIKTPKVFDGTVEPAMPDNKLNDATLLGVDSNHDGIRDDVEIWINRTIEDKNLRLIFKQMARNEIFAMSATEKGNEKSMISSFKHKHSLWGCAFDFHPFYSSWSTEATKNTSKIIDRLDKMIWKGRASLYEQRCNKGMEGEYYSTNSDSWKKCYSYVSGLEGKPNERN